jgi:hypothetical protein
LHFAKLFIVNFVKNINQRKQMTDAKQEFHRVYEDLKAFVLQDAKDNEAPEEHVRYLSEVCVKF